MRKIPFFKQMYELKCCRVISCCSDVIVVVFTSMFASINLLQRPPVPMTQMGAPARLSALGLLLCLQLGAARSPRTADQVSEADIQRLLHGVMEQLGIARPRVEYPAHQAINIVGPQSIQGQPAVDSSVTYKKLFSKV